MNIDNIVSLTITQATRTVSKDSFDLINILGPNLNNNSRITRFSTSSLSSVASALVGGTASPEYKMVAAIAAQSPRVKQVYISAIAGTKTLTDNAGTWTAGSVSVTINGEVVTQEYTSDKDTSMTALAAKIEALDNISDATYTSGSHTIVVTPDTGYNVSVQAITYSGITGTMTLALSLTATETITDALSVVATVDNRWYGLIITSTTQSDQLLAASYALSNKKICALRSAESDIINTAMASDTTSLPARLKAAANNRTAVIYNNDVTTEFSDAALLGKFFPYAPGSYTTKFGTLAGITASNLTTTQETNATDKNCFIDVACGGINILAEGKVSSGDWLDVIIFLDWLESTIKTNVYTQLVSNLKTAFDQPGIDATVSQIEAGLEEGIKSGGLTNHEVSESGEIIGGYFVEKPLASSFTSSQKNARILSGVEFTAFGSGAIHGVTINGTYTL